MTKQRKDLKYFHQDVEGQWWFWNETWSDQIGPYATYEEALDAFDNYCKYYLGSPFMWWVGRLKHMITRKPLY